MSISEFFGSLDRTKSIADFEAVLSEFIEANAESVKWVPFGGRENNRGTIEVSADPGRSLVERLTNGIDAILEAEHQNHEGRPNPRSPKEAAMNWLNIPSNGISEMSTISRRLIAQKVTIKVLSGEGRTSRLVEVRDTGIGILPQDMPNTILSLNETNKLQKHYLAGVYGQGGSSTLATSRYVLFASRYVNSNLLGFTIARYEDLPAEQFKIGRYVYLTVHGNVLETNADEHKFNPGTLVRHYGYDLTNYSASLGPNSLYGLLNQTLFDPIIPIWLDAQEVHNYRRVIKGTRNALNGAQDEGDDKVRADLAHKMSIFFVALPDAGRIGIEYWVLGAPTKSNTRPSASFVNPSKPIVLTLNGQNQAEMPQSLIRKDAELPYLAQRLVIHVDCNSLTPAAKRAFFVSNREDARRGMIYDLIYKELTQALKSDDQLRRINAEAREQGLRHANEDEVKKIRTEVAKLLRLEGIDTGIGAAAEASQEGASAATESRTPRIPRPPKMIELHDPPTYIKILWNDAPIDFFQSQRRYIRIETDAPSNYHDASNQLASRINVVLSNGLRFIGSTPLVGGQMRIILESDKDIPVGTEGTLRVELSRPSLSTLVDEHSFSIVQMPPTKEAERRITLPPFQTEPVEYNSEKWTQLGWVDDVHAVASSAEMDDKILYIYYSVDFPKYLEQRTRFENRDPAKAELFTKRYEIWLAVHSLLFYYDQKKSSDEKHPQQGDATFEDWERQERIRIATLATLFAAAETKSASAGINLDVD